MSDATHDEALIRSLRALRPAMPDAAAIRIAFEAGRRAGRRSTLRWRATSAALAGSLGLFVAWPGTHEPAGGVPSPFSQAIVRSPASHDRAQTWRGATKWGDDVDRQSAYGLTQIILNGDVDTSANPRGEVFRFPAVPIRAFDGGQL